MVVVGMATKNPKERNEPRTIGEAAEILGVSVATRGNRDESGQVKARRYPPNGYRLRYLETIQRLQKKIYDE